MTKIIKLLSLVLLITMSWACSKDIYTGSEAEYNTRRNTFVGEWTCNDAFISILYDTTNGGVSYEFRQDAYFRYTFRDDGTAHVVAIDPPATDRDLKWYYQYSPEWLILKQGSNQLYSGIDTFPIVHISEDSIVCRRTYDHRYQINGVYRGEVGHFQQTFIRIK